MPKLTPHLFRTSVDVAAIGAVGGEPYALQLALNEFRADTRLLNVGCASHLVSVLDGSASRAGCLVLCCHGDERGILLDELSADVAREQPFLDALTPSLAHQHVNLPGRTVISVGCCTGSRGLPEAFLAGGCRAYVGPTGYPDAEDTLMFAVALSYGLLARREKLEVAVERGRSVGRDAAMFKLYQPAA
jgi:hypothetical protein